MTGCLKMIDKDIRVELSDDGVDNSIIRQTKELVYVKPHLTCFGDVRDVTLGGSIPGAESLGGCIPIPGTLCNP